MSNWKTLRQQSENSLNTVYQNSSIWKWIQIQSICCCDAIKVHSCITRRGLHCLGISAEMGKKNSSPTTEDRLKKLPPVIKKLRQTKHQPRVEMQPCSWKQDRDLLPAVAAILAIISTLLAGWDAVAVTHLGYHHTAGEILLWTTVCSM